MKRRSRAAMPKRCRKARLKCASLLNPCIKAMSPIAVACMRGSSSAAKQRSRRASGSGCVPRLALRTAGKVSSATGRGPPPPCPVSVRGSRGAGRGRAPPSAAKRRGLLFGAEPTRSPGLGGESECRVRRGAGLRQAQRFSRSTKRAHIEREQPRRGLATVEHEPMQIAIAQGNRQPLARSRDCAAAICSSTLRGGAASVPLFSADVMPFPSRDRNRKAAVVRG
jgi:hypothetical protein